MPRQGVVELAADKRDDLGLGSQQFTCANPRCDVQFLRTPGPGRRKDFHDDECRRSAEKDLRRTVAQLAHHERQAEQLRARATAYLRTNLEDDPATRQPQALSDDQRFAAAAAVAEVRGMSRFLENHQGEFAQDLLKLYLAVEPLVR